MRASWWYPPVLQGESSLGLGNIWHSAVWPNGEKRSAWTKPGQNQASEIMLMLVFCDVRYSGEYGEHVQVSHAGPGERSVAADDQRADTSHSASETAAEAGCQEDIRVSSGQ